MKYFRSLLLSALLATTALAQRVQIGYPADQSTIRAGTNITVEVDRPNFQSSAQEVAIVIGIRSCFSGPCLPPTDGIGSVLYSGPYNPQYAIPIVPAKPPHQNFTVFIPSSVPQGTAQLNLAHFSLIGAGLEPFFETTNITLNVV